MADGSELAWFDLTSRQRSIWLDLQATGNLTNFQIGLYFGVSQKIDVDVLRQVLHDVIRRHDALRLRIDSDRPRQQLLSVPDVPLEIIELSNEDAPDEAFRRLVEQRFLQPFPLDRWPLFEFLVARADGGDHFMMRVHHAITDGISLGLLLADIAAGYNAKLGLVADAQKSSSYLRFLEDDIQYCASPRIKRDLDYWRERLVELPAELFPIKQSSVKPATASSIERSHIDFEQYRRFLATCEREELRPANVINAIISVVLGEWAAADDLVLGVTFPGRSKENRAAVGLFNGVLPVRVRPGAGASIRDLSQEITQQLNRDYLHYRPPLEEIWKTATFSGRRRRYACDVLVSYIPLEVFNFGVNFAGQVLSPTSLRGPEASPLAIYICEINQDRPVSVEFAFNRAFMTDEEAGSLSRKFHDLIQAFVENPTAPRAILADRDPSEAIDRPPASGKRDEPFHLRVLAGFTADPIGPPLEFWADQLGFDGEVSVAPYSQVFQELLDPASPSRRNRRGANLVLLRLEDLARERPEPSGEALAAEQRFLRSVAADFLKALVQAAAVSNAPYIVMICPPSERWDTGGPLEALQLDLLETIQGGVAGHSGISVVTYIECRALYPVACELDPAGDELGHLPYTGEAFSAMAALLARQLHLVLRPPIKVVIVDCDNTLWAGVVAEDGVDGLRLQPGHVALQSKLVELSKNGVLICLCSKNIESDVLSVFEQRPDMVLKLDHVVTKRINWNRKSENISDIASELDLSLDSFVFLDDSPLEVGEVEASLPQVLSILWESNNDLTGAACAHLWPLDSLPTTGEDTKRLERYRQNALRSEALQASASYSSFIEGLDLRIRIEAPSEADLPRLAQLTVRTNQFNLNGVRRSSEDIKRWMASPEAAVRAVSVTDKFGDYGLVGMLAAHRQGEELLVDTLLMSCRVLGRGVEHHIIAELGRLAADLGAAQVRIRLQVTERNLPIRRFLDGVGGEQTRSVS
ncbi:MAG TPA: HAD-IIIC family phosphatase, partial [Caulobacteraceae bacterium]|nr:HAD-IIIC family phosphatase [Caulobacteraceae bacterium]